MTAILSFIFETFLMPPGIFIVLLLLSLLLINKKRYLRILLIFQIVLIYILSIPVTSDFLYSRLESIAPLSEVQINNNQADVIVVLAGGIDGYAREYGGPDISNFTIPRLRYAAWLQKKTGLPVIVTGGIERGGATEAELMKKVLLQEYEIKGQVLVEKQSQSTYDNALYSSRIMAQHGYKRYFLVTSAFHMPRALDVFKRFNDNVIPAPAAYYYNRTVIEPGIFKPHSKTVWVNYQALHEIVGRYWYRLRYQ